MSLLAVCVQCEASHKSVLKTVVELLYEDRLKPSIQEISRRLVELKYECSYLKENIKSIAERFYDTFKVEGNGKDNVVMLLKAPKGFEGFVDCSEPTGSYSVEVIQEVLRYLLDLAGIKHCQASFQGGRHGLAKLLQTSGYGILRDQPLGVLCHIVQLLINAGMIAYEQNSLKLLVACTNVTRAMLNSSSSPSRRDSGKGKVEGKRGKTITTVEQARNAIRNLLKLYPRGIQLAQVKWKLYQHQEVTLNPDDLGHTKLGSLLSAEMSDIVVLVTNKKRLMVFLRKYYKRSIHGPIISNFGQGADVEEKREELSKRFLEAMKPANNMSFVSYNFWSASMNLHGDDMWSYGLNNKKFSGDYYGKHLLKNIEKTPTPVMEDNVAHPSTCPNINAAAFATHCRLDSGSGKEEKKTDVQKKLIIRPFKKIDPCETKCEGLKHMNTRRSPSKEFSKTPIMTYAGLDQRVCKEATVFGERMEFTEFIPGQIWKCPASAKTPMFLPTTWGVTPPQPNFPHLPPGIYQEELEEETRLWSDNVNYAPHRHYLYKQNINESVCGPNSANGGYLDQYHQAYNISS